MPSEARPDRHTPRVPGRRDPGPPDPGPAQVLGHDGCAEGDVAASSREARLARIVEGFLDHVRGGGALDIEPFLRASEELRFELEPLLLSVLRMEVYAERFERRRRP